MLFSTHPLLLSNQLISVAEVQFSEDCGILKGFYRRINQGKVVAVLHSDMVETMEIHTGA